MSEPTIGPAPGEESSDTVAQHPDALDLELDDVASLQPASVAMLEDAAGPDGAGSKDVAGPEVRVPRGVSDDGVPGVKHVGEVPARPLLAVHAGDHRAARSVELVGHHEN